MPRAIYVPVFDSFFESSIMQEEVTVRFVMLALVRLAWRSGSDGIVDVDMRTFAQSINLPLDGVQRSIQRLMEPDPASANPDEDGRRLVPVDPTRPFRNWRLVSWPKFRELMRAANDAARKRKEYHAKKDISEISTSLHISPNASGFRANLDTIRNEDEYEDDTKTKTKISEMSTSPRRSPRADSMAGFDSFWTLYPKKLGKEGAVKSWKKLTPEERAKAIAVVGAYALAMAGVEPEHIKNGQGWLTDKRFDDDPAAWRRATVARKTPTTLDRDAGTMNDGTEIKWKT
jgi:hypothetical protein